MSNSNFKLKNTIKYPTSLIVNGVNNLGLEVAESLLEQGGYVIFVDTYDEVNLSKIVSRFGDASLVSFVDYVAIPHLEEDLRRLDYVFYLAHNGSGDLGAAISTQNFLKYSNYLDTTLAFTKQFEAKFLLTTSIRAHLSLMDRLDIEVNYGANSTGAYSVYTDMEVQKYAESLTMEYISKTDLDAKVIRVGEVIGDGMDFSRQTRFNQLVIQAVVGEELELVNDGLEAEWYVHLLDAAYGVVRAQFTKNIRGEIYSLAYENPISDLSVAYRLQEIEPNSQEIRFKQESSRQSPLKLHKPAPNLSRIGWKPKVEFVQAVAESIAAAKTLAFDSNSGVTLPDDGVLGKLKNFVSPTRDQLPHSDVESGPVYRLIEERKKQQLAREQSLTKADRDVKFKHNKRNLTLQEKVNRWIYRNFFDSRTNFGFLRKMTPFQFITSVIMIGIILFIYFNFIAPAIVIGRNVLLVDSRLDQLTEAVNSQNFSEIEDSARELSELFEETADMLSSFEWVASVLAAEETLSDSYELIDLYQNYTKAISNIGYATVPIEGYLRAYSSNISYRPSSENYISTSSGTDYSIYLDELNSRRVYADLGRKELARTIRELRAFRSDSFPAELTTYLETINSRLLSVGQVSNFAGISENALELLGGRTPITYLVFIIDNSRPMPIGGKISAFAMFTIQNGSVSDMRIQPIDEFTPELDLPTYITGAMQNNITDNLQQYSVSDLSLIGNAELFAEAATQIWTSSFGKEIDIVAISTLESLSDSLEISNSVMIDGQAITKISLLTALATLQTDNPTSERRNDLIAQITAMSFEGILADLQNNLIPMVGWLSDSASTKNLVITRNDLKFNQVVVENQVFGNSTTSTDLPISVSLVSDPQLVSPTRFPTITNNLEVEIRDDSSMSSRLLVKFPGLSNVDQLSVCLPIGVREVTVTGVSFTRVLDRRNNDQRCTVVDVINETELSFEWETIQFESSSNPEYNLSVGQVKPIGTQVEYSVEISLAPSLSVTDIRPVVGTDSGNIAFSESLQKDQVIELVVTK